MTSRHKVQVLIPYYKEFQYFKEALESVLSQSLTDFNVLVVDDGTHDVQVRELIENLNDSRITLLQNDHNIGLARNFEYMRSISTGEYLVFLGQDDVMMPDYLSSVIPWFAEDPSIAIIQPKVKVIDSLGEDSNTLADSIKKLLFMCASFLGKKIFARDKDAALIDPKKAAAILLIGDFLYFPTLCWKSSSMSKFDTDREITLDYKMIIDVLSQGGRLLMLDETLAKYRRHENSASMKPTKMVDRLQEEKEFHLMISKNPLIANSKLLHSINYLRITQRMHSMQILLTALVRRDINTSKRALKCFL